MKFYAPEVLGPKRRQTPEGYLVCLDVPLARTGTQMYRDGEVPVPPGPDGIIYVERGEDQVFREETLASALGKSVVDEHPMTGNPTDDGWDVNPDNWREHTRGVILNPHRGEGVESDLLMGDVMITDASAIDAVLGGKVELSCGYNADYETVSPGRGRQHNIVINHVALVSQGRCGPRCSIGDEDTIMRTRDEKKVCATTTLDSAFAALDKIKRAFKSKTLDEAMLTEGMKQVTDGLEGAASAIEGGKGAESDTGNAQHIHVHVGGAAAPAAGAPAKDDAEAAVEGEEPSDPMAVIGGRIDKLEALFMKFAPILEKLGGGAAASEEAGKEEAEGDATADDGEDVAEGEVEEDNPVTGATGDGKPTKDGKTVRVRDSAHLAETFSGVVAKAEVLSPGISVPTFDAKLPATKTFDNMCAFRRKALAGAWNNEDIKPSVQTMIGENSDLLKVMPKMTCDAVLTLFNGATELARIANNAKVQGTGRTVDRKTGPGTLRDLNAANRKMYGQPNNG